MNQPLQLLLLSLLATTAVAAAESEELARARALFEANRYSEARLAFEKLLATEPTESDVHYYLGQLALEREDTETAVRELERATELAPGSARTHNALGAAYGRSAEKAGVFTKLSLARKCLAEFVRAVELEPSSADFRESLFDWDLAFCLADSEGQKERRFFKHLPDAETFQRTHDANPLLVGGLLERRTELLYCLERLKSMQVTLAEAVDPYQADPPPREADVIVVRPLASLPWRSR